MDWIRSKLSFCVGGSENDCIAGIEDLIQNPSDKKYQRIRKLITLQEKKGLLDPSVQRTWKFLQPDLESYPNRLSLVTQTIAYQILFSGGVDPFCAASTVRTLGQGISGCAYQIRVQESDYVRKSSLSDTYRGADKLSLEYHHLMSLNHPNIVQAIHLDNGTLIEALGQGVPFKDADFQKTCNTMEAMQFLWHLADGIAYMHDNGLCHNDIHTGNVLVLSTHQPLIIDLDNSGPISQLAIEQELAFFSIDFFLPLYMRLLANTTTTAVERAKLEFVKDHINQAESAQELRTLFAKALTDLKKAQEAASFA